MRWKNPLSSGLKRSIESLPDRVMQGFGVGMEISRMRAAREQAAQDRANEAARYRQETARRAQERQQDIGWRAEQAKTSAGQWAADQAFRQKAFEAQQAEVERERQAREAAAEAARLRAPIEEQRAAERHAVDIAEKKARAAAGYARAGTSRARTKQIGDVMRQQEILTRQYDALRNRADQAIKQYVDLSESAYDEGLIEQARKAAEEAVRTADSVHRKLAILQGYQTAEEEAELRELREMDEQMRRERGLD
jgi:colicin import membrane protein